MEEYDSFDVRWDEFENAFVLEWENAPMVRRITLSLAEASAVSKVVASYWHQKALDGGL